MPDPTQAPAPDDAWLDQALRADAHEAAAYIADDGFTARVMAALPAAVRIPAWRKPAVALLWGAGIVGGALALPEAFADLAHEAFRLASHPYSLPQAAAAVALLGAAMWSAAAWTLRRD
jgi:hypothetical protein